MDLWVEETNPYRQTGEWVIDMAGRFDMPWCGRHFPS
jgi:hypothetical protein